MQSFRLFLEQREDPVIFIDLDGTLVHTVFWPRWAEMLTAPAASRRDHFASLRDIRERFLYMSEDEQLDVMQKLGGQPVRHKDVLAVSFLRPGAREFLIECMGIARTCILTQGVHRMQEKVAEAVDLPVRDVFGNHGDPQHVEYGSKVPGTPAAVLVDDMPRDSALVQKKLKAIGLPESTDRFIGIEKWEGKGGDPKVFDPVLKKIRQLVKV